jgi:NADH-quinone oxidoreductase subunit C
MNLDEIADRLEDLHEGAVLGRFAEPAKDPYLRIASECLVEVMQSLHSDHALAFELLISITGMDWSTWAPKMPRVKKGEEALPEPETPGSRYDVVYHLLSVSNNHRLVVKVACPDDAQPALATLCGIYPAADWLERETWDLMGIDFFGHPDLRRILCAEDWVGHPLRKDYEFPLVYHGISAE